MKRSNIISEYISSEKKIFKLEWKEIFNLKKISDKYIAQGIVRHNGYVIFSIHKKNKKSVILFFKENEEELKLIDKITMPLEATHTSDLAIYKNKLYAIDFYSNFIYRFSIKDENEKINLELEKKVKIFMNGRNFGSFAIVEKEEKIFLIATSFANDNRIWVFDFNDLFEKQLGFDDSLVFETEGSFFTQGIYYNQKKDSFFISVNRLGKDYIYKININNFLLYKDINKAIEEVYLAPGRMIEDIYIDDENKNIYTSDEETNKIYKAKLNKKEKIINENKKTLKDYKFHDKLLSHRNRTDNFQENTMDGFIAVLDTNIKYIEIDIRLSSDNKYFVYHDSYFRHGFNVFKFYDKTLNEIRRERYKNNKIRVSEFENILRYFQKYKKNGQILAIDIKDFGEEEKLIELIQKYSLVDFVIFYTWTTQTIFKLDDIFKKRKITIPIYFSHVRTDSIFRYIFIPQFLNWKKYFLVFRDFVLVGNHNYKTPLGRYARGYRHVPYFFKIPEDLMEILKRNNGGICASIKSRRFTWFGARYFEKMKKNGLKVSVFGPFFGEIKIDKKESFENIAKDKNIDIVFMDNLNKMF